MTEQSVVIVGGGFAGVGCAKRLAKHGFSVTLIDKNNYHQFQPLLYQVATAELATSDVARPLRAIFKKYDNVHVHRAEVTHVDPGARTVSTADGHTFSGTTWCSRPGRSPTTSAPPARASTRSRSTRWSTREHCGLDC